MRLGYFTMPLHPPQRDPLQTLQEDREAVVLADKLGFHDAFVGEQLTDRCENVTNSFIFLATLVGETKTIKLATGTSNLSQSHPVLVKQSAARRKRHRAKRRGSSIDQRLPEGAPVREQFLRLSLPGKDSRMGA